MRSLHGHTNGTSALDLADMIFAQVKAIKADMKSHHSKFADIYNYYLRLGGVDKLVTRLSHLLQGNRSWGHLVDGLVDELTSLKHLIGMLLVRSDGKASQPKESDYPQYVSHLRVIKDCARNIRDRLALHSDRRHRKKKKHHRKR